MLKTSYQLGSLSALEKFALDPRLFGTLAGAAMGSMAAPEGEGLQGAILGGGTGYLGGAGVSRGWNAAKGLGTKILHPAGEGQSLIGNLSNLHMNDPMANQRFVQRELDSELPNFVRKSAKHPAQAPMFYKQNSEFGVSAGIPGTSIGINRRSREERLPGMHKWVPRDVIEKAHEGLDQGMDPQALLEQSADEGQYLDPLLGAGTGAAAMHFGLPDSGIAGKGLGALLGGGLGAILHQISSQHRQRDMGEALEGVLRERAHEGIIEGQGATTASEPAPMLVSRGGGEG